MTLTIALDGQIRTIDLTGRLKMYPAIVSQLSGPVQIDQTGDLVAFSGMDFNKLYAV